jgi:hypothetical protein
MAQRHQQVEDALAQGVGSMSARPRVSTKLKLASAVSCWRARARV